MLGGAFRQLQQPGQIQHSPELSTQIDYTRKRRRRSGHWRAMVQAEHLGDLFDFDGIAFLPQPENQYGKAGGAGRLITSPLRQPSGPQAVSSVDALRAFTDRFFESMLAR